MSLFDRSFLHKNTWEGTTQRPENSSQMKENRRGMMATNLINEMTKTQKQIIVKKLYACKGR